MLLFESRHRTCDFLHENLRVGQRFVIFGEYLIFENAKVLCNYDLVLQGFQVAQGHIKDHFIVFLPEEKEKVKYLQGGLFRQTFSIE